jgi:predicted enzyme related to lactoylglutathione lyase
MASKRVIGLGGIFIKCQNPKETAAWYAKHLGVTIDEWGGVQFKWSDETHKEPYSVLSFFKSDTKYLDPSASSFMINLRVANLEEVIQELQAEGIEMVGEPQFEAYGKFAWIMDPEGNKIELWEQV